ncbi:universal stress protein [Robiginitalea aurantiaca]|uniref:Universal stress protein n=1 Tax=Robiginitalea aurantiaca TaxID=3056915 RepID=A0ABT7WHD4_9FLAO|nr:universal stress protein [Robiginitalea aurantiaca]MDM9632273.1 universal stress protein [Robiginitalea aurantiaca]
MKTILIPTDFSQNAWNALFTALKLFRNEDCRFLLLNTYEPNLINVLGDQGEKRLGLIYESLEAESREKMKNVLNELTTYSLRPGNEFKTRCAPGDLVSEVKKLVKKGRIDMIVMGTKGASGADRVFMGSNAVRILKHISNRPILAVPEGYNFQALKTVLLPTDFMHYYESFELQPLLDLMEPWEAEVRVAYAAKEFKLNSTQESNKKLLQTRLKSENSRFVEIPLETSVSDSIRQYGSAIEADMIALMQHRHSFLEAVTKEKVVKRIAFDTEIPLFILPKRL